MEFKYRLKEIRIKKGLTQDELAKAMIVCQRTISGWETGYRKPDVITLLKLSEFFEVSSDYLLGMKDYPD